jgi:hypothetical protein
MEIRIEHKPTQCAFGRLGYKIFIPHLRLSEFDHLQSVTKPEVSGIEFISLTVLG